MVVTKVEKLEPLPLRMEWMNDLAQAVAYLESLNLAHGDLRPENILLDRNRLKLSDFDCTAEIGADYEACMAPYGRILNSHDTDQGKSGTFGFLGSRTEQFALGSLYYLMNYGFEVYGDRCLTEDPYEHGPKVVELLQNMEFPILDGNPLIDDIIDKCWHNKYATVSELAAHTEKLLRESTHTVANGLGSREEESRGVEIREDKRKEEEVRAPIKAISIVQWCMILGRVTHALWCGLEGWWAFVFQSTKNKVKTAGQANHDSGYKVDQNPLEEDLTSKKVICQDLEKRGLLRVLSSDEPEQLGFTFDCAYSRADDRSLGKGVRLTQCPRCKRFADKYVEYDFVVIFIDLVLIKPQVYRHLLFNRLESDERKFDPSITRLGVLLLLFDVYLTWARIEKSPSIEGTFLERTPIIIQYLFFLTLNALATLAHHLTVRLLASIIAPASSCSPTPTRQPTTTPNAAATEPQPAVVSDPTTPVLPSFPPQQAPAQHSSLSPPKGTPQSSAQELPGVENQRPLQPSPSSPRDSFCGLPPPLRRASTAPVQTIQPLSPPSQTTPTAISTALFVSSCAKLFPILLVIWGPDGRISSSSSTYSSGSITGAASTAQSNIAQRALGGTVSAIPSSVGSNTSVEPPSSVSASLLEGLIRVIPSGIPTSYVISLVDLVSSLFTLGAADAHLVLLSNIEALYILLGCGYFRAMALAVAGLMARWTVQKVILGAVGVG
ncbi:sterol homeostasis protein ARV1 [Aspergillus mulundensis]|uniref:Protein ARV n=1 Tax=Aspergillus mulundensis TaxID=1810919 RepID=A0A3D8SX36_9EURO|nr:hypothetical protein DSM5745_02605 [Aspergillus mulundensis]RDW90830.1 hypothetical protein DSM5745_02605 [Aspergillus mulundensis]